MYTPKRKRFSDEPTEMEVNCRYSAFCSLSQHVMDSRGLSMTVLYCPLLLTKPPIPKYQRPHNKNRTRNLITNYKFQIPNSKQIISAL